ncbi:hypothetical protein RNZ50_16830 [Paracoccaceae bacterium Fryx2]|nr:hypothetical protein [Paracoccaceae bacterium Fryx2]
MTRSALPFVLLAALAACTPTPAPAPVGSVSHAGQSYPIRATPNGWAVRTPDTLVPCRAATERDCYWSLRAHLNAIDQLDSLPG